MKTADIAKRLERLLNGKGEPRDFDAFFLWVRETRRSHGNQIIEDIGHFVAHADERTKGVSWTRVSQFAAMATFIIPRLRGVKNQTLDQFNEACEASLALLPDAKVREFFAFNKVSANQLLKSGLKKIRSFDGRNMVWGAEPSKREFALIERLASILSAQDAFSEDELLTEFTTCIAKNSVVEQSRVPELEQLRPLLSLYVVEKMQLTRIALRDGRVASLEARSDDTSPASPVIAVTGTVPIELDGWTLPMAFNVYTSSLKPAEWCYPELLVPNSRAWQFPLEIGPDWKLRLLP